MSTRRSRGWGLCSPLEDGEAACVSWSFSAGNICLLSICLDINCLLTLVWTSGYLFCISSYNLILLSFCALSL